MKKESSFLHKNKQKLWYCTTLGIRQELLWNINVSESPRYVTIFDINVEDDGAESAIYMWLNAFRKN